MIILSNDIVSKRWSEFDIKRISNPYSNGMWKSYPSTKKITISFELFIHFEFLKKGFTWRKER